ncbi:MAG TPA: hypothetical protein VL921_19115 [Candidatus Udaeobacter sp.]|jgi:hypothetical protein|nr:hypothetical protein [Candidatus Udaeobacter sp.]
MAEKNILAFFNSPEQAKDALQQLKGLNLIDTSIDRVNAYPGSGSDHVTNPITGNIPSLGYLTLGGDFNDRNAGILAATSVSASDMSAGGPDNKVTGINTVLTIVVDEADFEQALKTVQNAGALV